jgi:hypothetical protein
MAGKGDDGHALVVSDAQGNYYYLRPEILRACKVADEEIEAVKEAAAPGAGPRSTKASRAEVVGSLRVQKPLEEVNPELAQTLKASMAASTTMCPW